MNPNQYHSDLIEILNNLLSIPPHNPERFETTDGYEDPDCTNGKRAAFATTALDVFQKTCRMTEETETAAADLICDLLHLVHASGSQPLATLESALGHFIAEAG
jgi:hypothetical protein